MQYAIDMTDSTHCRLSITVSASEVKNSMEAALHELKKDAPKGFTLEDAAENDPFLRRVVESAAGNMISVFTGRALQEADKHPVARPHLEEEELPRYGQEYAFVMLADVLPEIVFPEDFSGISLNVREPDVSPREVFRAVERLMRPVVKLEDVRETRLPAGGDLAVVDVQGDLDGMPVPGLRRGEMVLPLDAFPEAAGQEMAPEKDVLRTVEDVARTLHMGESGEGSMSCPDDYPDPSLRGRKIRLKVTLKKLLRRVTPSLTDEVAARLGYPDARTLKTKACAMAMNHCIQSRRKEAGEQLMRMLLGMADIPVPESLLRSFFGEYMADVRNFLENSEGVDASRLEAVLAAAREQGMRVAEENAKRHVYLLAYACKAGISVPDRELDEQVRAMAERAGRPADEIRRSMEENGMLDVLEERMMADKALGKIYAMVKKRVVDAAGNPVSAPEFRVPA